MQMLRLGVTSVLGRSLTTYLKNFIPFTILSAIVHVPSLLVILTITSGETSEKTIETYDRFSSILDMLLSNLAAGAMSYGVFRQLKGEHVGIGRSIAVGLSRLLPVLGVGLLCAVLIGLGYLALVIPGVILSCMFFVAVPAAVVERPGLIGALKRSNQLTSGHKGSIFGIVLLMGLIMVVVGIVVALALVGGDLADVGQMRTFFIAVWGLSIIFGSWQSVAVAVTYHDLRLMKDGIDEDELIRVFE